MQAIKQLLPQQVQSFYRRLRNQFYKAILDKWVLNKQFIQMNYSSKDVNDFDLNFDRVSNYYSPLPAAKEIEKNEKRWNKPSALLGIKYDEGEMKSFLNSLLIKYGKEFTSLPTYQQLQGLGFGAGYTPVDALTLYCMIREIKPKRYIEVGSGLSTYYCSLAGIENSKDGHPLQMTCIEPNPYPKLHEIRGIQLISSEVQNVPLETFDTLEEGDIFFIDSSHVLKIDGDVSYLYLEVLPRLKKGVHIHMHDISFPYNVPYPAKFWVLDRKNPMYWTEAMLVQAFLAFNDHFKITLSVPLIRFLDEPFLKGRIPHYQTAVENPNTCSSLWVKRVG